MLLCYCDGFLNKDEDDSIYIGVERRVFLIDCEVTFDLFEGLLMY